MIGILFLVMACAAQGVGAGFLRGTANVAAITTAPAQSLFVSLPGPIMGPIFIPPVDSATEASLRAARQKTEINALLELSPLLITGHVVMPLPDLQRCPLQNTTLAPLQHHRRARSWSSDMYAIGPYVGPAELAASVNQQAERTAEGEILQKQAPAVYRGRVPWLGV